MPTRPEARTGDALAKTRVVMFERRAMAGRQSLERVFDAVRDAAPPHVSFEVHRLPHEGRGLVPRLRNMAYAWRHRGPVNHVGGDVHYLALALPRRRTVLTVADLAGLTRLRGLRRLALELLWYRLPVAWVAQVVTISDWTRQQLLELVPAAAGKVRTIPCPLPSLPECRTEAPPAGKPVLLQVGTAWNKNLLRVVEAVSGLDLHLRIIGPLDAEQSKLIESWGIDYSNVEWVDERSLTAEYERCDALVFASTYEGFGLPIVEAQSLGRPVITSRVASMPEVAGGGALLVDPHSVAEIRAAVVEVLSDDGAVEEMIARGRVNVDRFQPARIAKEYTQIWTSIQNDRRRAS